MRRLQQGAHGLDGLWVAIREGRHRGGKPHLHQHILAQTLSAVARDGMGDLVTQYGRQARIVPRDGKDASINGHLTSRQGEGIGLLVLDDLKLPLEVFSAGGFGNAGPDTPDLLVQRLVGRELSLAEHLLIGLEPQPDLIRLRQQQELRAARNGDRLACRDAHNHKPRKPVGGIPSRSAHGKHLSGVDGERQGKKEFCAAFSGAPQETKAIKPEAQS